MDLDERSGIGFPWGANEDGEDSRSTSSRSSKGMSTGSGNESTSGSDEEVKATKFETGSVEEVEFGTSIEVGGREGEKVR